MRDDKTGMDVSSVTFGSHLMSNLIAEDRLHFLTGPALPPGSGSYQLDIAGAKLEKEGRIG